MNVLIVSRTKMGESGRCIGGLCEDNQQVRLLPNDSGEKFNVSCPFQIGQVWDINFKRVENILPPHFEDAVVLDQKFISIQNDLSDHLNARVQPWTGGISRLFDRLLAYTGKNNGFVSEARGVPSCSTGFWIPNKDLILQKDKRHFGYRGVFAYKNLAYVGEIPTIEKILAGTLVRVSLARWWRPEEADDDFEFRCYLQLSGWY